MNAPHDLAIRTVEPIQVKKPNGQILQSTKVCRLPLRTLTYEAIESHILPGLLHRFPTSIGKLCDDGCETRFNQHTMAVTKDKQVVFQGTRDAMTVLWIVPLQSLDTPTHQSNNIHQVNGK